MLVRLVMALCVMLFITAEHEAAADLLLFPSITVTHLSRPVTGMTGMTQSEATPSLGIFYVGDHEKVRWLAEYTAATDMHGFERLQLGWKPEPDTIVWLGRFHSPAGYWASKFHHSPYLRTSISSPGVGFDDEGGPFPTHIAGLLIEGAAGKDGAIGYSFGIGKGPVMQDQLEPTDILNPGGSDGELTAAAKLAYTPLGNDEDEIGIFAGHADIPVAGLAVNGVVQNLVGVFLNLEMRHARLIGEIYRASNRLDKSASSSTFTSAYLHGEYKIHPDWTIFGRIENTFGAERDPYLDLLPMFTRNRKMTGVRYEVARHHAIKLELSRNAQQDGTRYSQLAIQWSMVFP